MFLDFCFVLFCLSPLEKLRSKTATHLPVFSIMKNVLPILVGNCD